MTTGDSTDFGDMTYAAEQLMACSNSTRGLISGGGNPGSMVNTINMITIATTGNAADFGDLTTGRNHMAGCSNGHGGL